MVLDSSMGPPATDSILEQIAECKATQVHLLDHRVNADYTDNNLLDLLHFFQPTSCADPRDKVYAARGLAEDLYEGDIKPNYTKPIVDVYTETTTYRRETSTEPFDVLGHVQPRAQNSALHDGARYFPDLPSWVPNWSEGWSTPPFRKGHELERDVPTNFIEIQSGEEAPIAISLSTRPRPLYSAGCLCTCCSALRSIPFPIQIEKGKLAVPARTIDHVKFGSSTAPFTKTADSVSAILSWLSADAQAMYNPKHHAQDATAQETILEAFQRTIVVDLDSGDYGGGHRGYSADVNLLQQERHSLTAEMECSTKFYTHAPYGGFAGPQTELWELFLRLPNPATRFA